MVERLRACAREQYHGNQHGHAWSGVTLGNGFGWHNAESRDGEYKIRIRVKAAPWTIFTEHCAKY